MSASCLLFSLVRRVPARMSVPMSLQNNTASNVAYATPACSTFAMSFSSKPTGEKTESKALEPPKRPASAAALYLKENFHAIKAKNPGAKVSEVLSLTHKEFKALPEEARKPYVDHAEQLRKVYKAAKEKAAENDPKSKARSAYAMYIRANFKPFQAAHPDIKCATDVTRMLAAQWKAMSAEEKGKYKP